MSGARRGAIESIRQIAPSPILVGISTVAGQLQNESSTYLGVNLPPISQSYPGQAVGSWKAQMWSNFFVNLVAGCNQCMLTIPMLFGTGWHSGDSGQTTSPQAPTDATGTGNSPTVMTMADVAAGVWDMMFTNTFTTIASVRPDAILRIGWESYGNWYAWAGAPNNTEYPLVFRHLVNLARAVSSRFKFDWNGAKVLPGSGYDPMTSGQYPGDAYVDYIGADIYDQTVTSAGPFGSAGWNGINQGPGGNPGLNSQQSLAEGYAFASSHGKPFTIPEYGFMGGANGGGDDPSWITACWDYTVGTPNIGYAMFYDKSTPSQFATYPNGGAALSALFKAYLSPGPPPSGTIYAAYAGSNNYAGIQTFAAATGLNITAVSDYCSGASWAGIENPPLSNFVGKGKRLCLGVNMGPDSLFSGHGGNTTTTLTSGKNGAYNSHYVTLATNLVNQGFHDAILRIGWEFGANQPWSPTSSSDPPLYAAYFAQIVTAMRSVAGQSFMFDWNPLWGFTTFSETAAYPGDAYVDIISTDIYDQSYSGTCFPPSGTPGNTATTAQSNCAFNDMRTTNNNSLNSWLAMATAHNKHWACPEWGVNNDQQGASGHGLGDDPQFVTNQNGLFHSVTPYYASYFAFDYGGTDLFNIADGSFPNALARLKSLSW